MKTLERTDSEEKGSSPASSILAPPDSAEELIHSVATMIEMINSSTHHQVFRSSRTAEQQIDIILHDHLLALNDSDANKILQVAIEVDICAEFADIKQKVSCDVGYVTGRANYVLNYKGPKSGLENALVVIKAKKDRLCSTAITQTLCYLTSV